MYDPIKVIEEVPTSVASQLFAIIIQNLEPVPGNAPAIVYGRTNYADLPRTTQELLLM